MRREHKTKEAIADFLADKDWVGFEKIAIYCKDEFQIHRNTVKKYLDEMKMIGHIEQSPDGRHPYRMTEDGRKYYFKEHLRTGIYELTESYSTELLKTIVNILDIIRRHGLNSKFYFGKQAMLFIPGMECIWFLDPKSERLQGLITQEGRFIGTKRKSFTANAILERRKHS